MVYENNACLMFLPRFIHEPSHQCQNRISSPVIRSHPPSVLRRHTLGEANTSPPKPTSSQPAARVRPSKSTPNSLANSAPDRAVLRPLPSGLRQRLRHSTLSPHPPKWITLPLRQPPRPLMDRPLLVLPVVWRLLSMLTIYRRGEVAERWHVGG